MIQLKAGSKDLLSERGLIVVLVDPKELSAKRAGKGATALQEIEKKSGIAYRKFLEQEGFQAAEGSSSFFRLVGELACRAVLFVGWEAKKDHLTERYRKLGALVAKNARCHRIDQIAFLEEGMDLTQQERLIALVEGAFLSGYTFQKYKKKPKTKPKEIKKISILTRKKVPVELSRKADIYVQSTCLARDLVNTPSSDCHAPFLISTARKIARDGKLKLRVFDKAKLKKMKAGGILGVNQASAQPPALIALTYKPKTRAKKVISIVGKGVTFDSGGLSIKTGGGMLDMKCDMAGAAAVLGAMLGVSRLKPSVEVRGYVPVAENMVNEHSMKLGDVLHIMNGKTVEITNTDAEGRLILADALSLAVKEECDQVIDLDTLTGACLVALGQDYAGLFSEETSLRDGIIEAGRESGEDFWHLPLVDRYRKQLDSDVADMKNSASGYGGTIRAALFLREFVGETPWAHIDLAGPAFLPSASEYSLAGATGFGVRTLLRYVSSL